MSHEQQEQQNNVPTPNGQNEESFTGTDHLQGLLISYTDDQLDDCVKAALKHKSRVKYRFMDTFSTLLAFGTSGGAIYIFRLGAVSHSSCNLACMIPCDQGSTEVIKFLPKPQTDDLFIAIGTVRGSLIIFKLSQMVGDDNLSFNEVYRAESFTNNQAIKLIECDHNLLDLSSPFTRLYISDAANRLYALDSGTICAHKQNTLRLFYTNNLPSLVFSVNDSNINQISVHKSQLLISTDETTRLFNENSNELHTIGKKKRKRGFYGACFVNLAYRPNNVLETDSLSEVRSPYSSTGSLTDYESINMFVSRPMFRLWQVNHRLEVTLTHQFEAQIKSCEFKHLIEMDNEATSHPESSSASEQKLLDDLEDRFSESGRVDASLRQVKSSHFQKLLHIHSSTLGNLLLSYTSQEIFIVDPITAHLIVWYSQEEPIVQVCCNQNELFVWSSTRTAADATGGRAAQEEFRIKRLVLLAPSQFVLELHRLHHFAALASFVQLFSDLFRHKLALPLTGQYTLTTEGGLLRNILLNAWEMLNHSELVSKYRLYSKFQKMITEILEESRQLKQSLDDISNSRFLLNMTNENIDRLFMEPYASLVSLEVSIKDLHTKHVIQFTKTCPMARHKSAADLSRSLWNLKKSKSRKPIQSQLDLSNNTKSTHNQIVTENNNIKESLESLKIVAETPGKLDKGEEEAEDEIKSEEISMAEEKVEQEQKSIELEISNKDIERCSYCRWPGPRGHLRPLSPDQQAKLQWISDNLMSNFVENIEEIKKEAFEYGLWQTFLKCLAFNNQIDDYITCCMSLDDIRLIDIEQFIIIYCGEVEVLDRLLVHLDRRYDDETSPVFENMEEISKLNRKCLKCGNVVEQMKATPNGSDEPYESNSEASDSLRTFTGGQDKFSFELINIAELFMKRRNADVGKIIGCLLRQPKLVNKSRISTTFYLKAIANATLKANQLQVNRAKIKTTTLVP